MSAAVRSFRYWSPTHGCNVVRLGAVGSDGMERFVFVDVDQAGKERRRKISIAIGLLEDRIDSFPPGEVAVNYDEEVA